MAASAAPALESHGDRPLAEVCHASVEENIAYYGLDEDEAEDRRGLHLPPKWVRSAAPPPKVGEELAAVGKGWQWAWIAKRLAEIWTLWLRVYRGTLDACQRRHLGALSRRMGNFRFRVSMDDGDQSIVITWLGRLSREPFATIEALGELSGWWETARDKAAEHHKARQKEKLDDGVGFWQPCRKVAREACTD